MRTVQVYRVVCSHVVRHRIVEQRHYDYRWYWQAEIRRLFMTYYRRMFCCMYIRRMYAK